MIYNSRYITSLILLILVFCSFFTLSENILKYPNDSVIVLDSLDSIYLRHTDFHCSEIDGFMIICTTTERERDSIINTRTAILRRRRYFKISERRWLSKEQFDQIFNKPIK